MLPKDYKAKTTMGGYVMKNMKKHLKYVIIAVLTLLLSIIVFYIIHPTYYKYNDIWIMGNTISDIKNRYGEFDLFNDAYAAYYIYTDNKDFLPDHLKHYYYMYYDENNIVYNVEDSCQPGG